MNLWILLTLGCADKEMDTGSVDTGNLEPSSEQDGDTSDTNETDTGNSDTSDTNETDTDSNDTSDVDEVDCPDDVGPLESGVRDLSFRQYMFVLVISL